MDGSDLNDWFRATAILAVEGSEHDQGVPEAEPHSAVEAISEKLQAVVNMAAGAAHAIAGLFATHDRSKKSE